MKSFFLAAVLLVSALPAAGAQSLNDMQWFNERLQYAQVANVDEASDPAYYGFQNPDGAWYIIKKTTSASIDTFTYAKGDSAYSTAWTGRAALTYATPESAF